MHPAWSDLLAHPDIASVIAPHVRVAVRAKFPDTVVLPRGALAILLVDRFVRAAMLLALRSSGVLCIELCQRTEARVSYTLYPECHEAHIARTRWVWHVFCRTPRFPNGILASTHVQCSKLWSSTLQSGTFDAMRIHCTSEAADVLWYIHDSSSSQSGLAQLLHDLQLSDSVMSFLCDAVGPMELVLQAMRRSTDLPVA
jgi:hypothetical protein